MNNANSKKKWTIGVFTSFFAFITVFSLIINQNIMFKSDADIEPYSIVLNKDQNKLCNQNSGSSYSNATKIRTNRGTMLNVSYTSFYNTDATCWNVIGNNGGFENIDAINGLKTIKVKAKNENLSYTITWSETSDFATSDSKTFASSSSSYVTCNFDNVYPNYFRFKNTSGVNLAIESITITFSCEDQYNHSLRQENYINNLEFGASILYSNEIKNKTKNHYIGSYKSSYHLENEKFGLDYSLTGSKKYVTNFYSVETNKSYFTNTSDPYIVNGSDKIYASDSDKISRNNTWDLGYYYNNTHFLDQTFGNPSQGVTNYLNLLNPSNISFTYDVTNLQTSSDGVFSFDVTSAYDPQVVWNTNYDASDYNYLHVRLRSQKSGSFTLFMASSGHGLSAEQSLGCKLNINGEFNDYYLALDTMPNYTGTITKLRIDLGVLNEHIEISKFEVFKPSNSLAGSFGLDRSYHMYGDKLYEEDTVVCLKESGTLDNIGQEIKINKTQVDSVLIYDNLGNYNTNSHYIGNNKAIGFLLKDTGVIGIILPYNKSYSASVYVDSNFYYVQIISNSGTKTYSHLEQEKISFRIYNDIETDFEAFKKEVYIENHPLSPSIYLAADSASFLGYNSTKGCYDFAVNGGDMNGLYYSYPNRNYQIHALISSADDREIYISGNSSTSMFLESAAVLDKDQNMLPIPIEVCKNYQGENEESTYDPGDKFYSKAIMPLSISQGQSLKFTLIHLYQNWGLNPLKQISSIRFHTEYYHLSTGVTETNCIAPEVDNYLPDFRSMSAPLWSGQPQHTSFGSNKLTKYVNSSGNSIDARHIDDVIDSAGPTYADMTLNNMTTDGKIKATYRHVEMPQTDENRTYYEIDYEVLDTVTIDDFKNNFSIFSANTRAEQYANYGYLGTDNAPHTVGNSTDSSFNNQVVLGTNHPYFDIYNCTNKTDYVNLALVVKDSDIVINGQNVNTNFVVRNNFIKSAGCNYIDMSLNLDNVTLKEGDHLHFNIILLPWGSQESIDDSNVRYVREDTCLHPFSVSASEGTVIPDNYLIKVDANRKTQSATFTVSGGRNVVTPRIYNFNNLGRPHVEEYIDGQWVDYTYNVYAYDGFSVYFEEDNTFSYAFPVNMGDSLNNSRTFRVTIV